MENSYYNTNHLKGNDLKEANQKAKSQEDIILEFMKEHPAHFSPSVIQRRLFGRKTPLTSIRRAMTRLEQANHIVKTKKMVMGIYGKPGHTWLVKDAPLQTQLF
jgi:hypothetical protein